MWGATTMIQYSVLQISKCHKPFLKIKPRQKHTHIHPCIYLKYRRCKKLQEMHGHNDCFCVFVHLQWQYVMLTHFIPLVQKHYSCCFPLIDSSFFHFISSQWAQTLLQALLPWIGGHYEEQKEDSNEDEYMHKLLFFMCIFINRNTKLKFKLCVPAALFVYVGQMICENGPFTRAEQSNLYRCAIVFPIWWYS